MACQRRVVNLKLISEELPGTGGVLGRVSLCMRAAG
jgi:hypothetical protein